MYKRFIKPVLCVSDSKYEPVVVDIKGEENNWYEEKERHNLFEKYKHMENTFEHVIFKSKYERVYRIDVDASVAARLRTIFDRIRDELTFGSAGEETTITKAELAQWQNTIAQLLGTEQ